MNARTLTLGLASTITTFLLAAALTIQLLSGYGESPGVGILGVGIGAVAGLLVGVAVVAAVDRLPGVGLAALVAYGTLGAAFLAIALLQYVNVPGADDLFSFPVHLGVSVVLAVVAAVLTGRGRRRDATNAV